VVGGDVVDGVGQNWTVILGTLGIAVVVYLLGSLRVLWQYERGVVFLLGEFEGVRAPGLTLIFCARLRCKSVAKTITKDNVSIHIAAVAYYHISHPSTTLSRGNRAAGHAGNRGRD
jgi:regulator of protease activity HflC (stomatin/prohibitin superfamily)